MLKDDFKAMCLDPASGPEPDELAQRAAALRERDPSATMQDLFHFIEQRVEFRRAFDRGEWVRLPITSDDDGLWWYWHDWRKFPEDDVVEFGNRTKGKGVQMALRMRFPIPFEIEATVEQLGSRSVHVPVGLLTGDFRTHNRADKRPHAAVTLNDYGEFSPIEGLELMSIVASSNGERHLTTRNLIARRPNQRLGMLVWPDTFEATVSGNPSRPDANVQQQYVASNEIAIGWWVPNANAGLQHLRVASPRIRKLPYGSAPVPDAPIQDRTKYFTEVLRVHPDSVRAHRSLAVLSEGRDPEASRRHAVRALELDPLIGDMHKLRGKEHLARSEYAAALQEFDAEFRVSPTEPDVRVWLARLLCGVPDDALRDPGRAVRLSEESEKLVRIYIEDERKPVLYGRPMLLAEQGQFDEALQALDVLEPVVADDDAELQWIAQQRAAFSQRKPFRFHPLVESIPSALAPVNVAKPAADSNRQ